MTQHTPPGTILDDSLSPILIMSDELGIFVSSGRYRHYCESVGDAQVVAIALRANGKEVKR